MQDLLSKSWYIKLVSINLGDKVSPKQPLVSPLQCLLSHLHTCLTYSCSCVCSKGPKEGDGTAKPAQFTNFMEWCVQKGLCAKGAGVVFGHASLFLPSHMVCVLPYKTSPFCPYHKKRVSLALHALIKE
jgi:hypothetical protein